DAARAALPGHAAAWPARDAREPLALHAPLPDRPADAASHLAELGLQLPDVVGLLGREVRRRLADRQLLGEADEALQAPHQTSSQEQRGDRPPEQPHAPPG